MGKKLRVGRLFTWNIMLIILYCMYIDFVNFYKIEK
jgi:hypothetical protein